MGGIEGLGSMYPNILVLGIWVIVIIVPVLGKYITISINIWYLDP